MDCEVSLCPREGYWSAINSDGRLKILCSEHLGMFNTFGHKIVSWSRRGKDTIVGIQ